MPELFCINRIVHQNVDKQQRYTVRNRFKREQGEKSWDTMCNVSCNNVSIWSKEQRKK